MYDPWMEPGEFIPTGEPAPSTADAPPGPSETQETPRIRGALILPVVFGVAAWAVDRFTRSALGDWRYAPVAVLGLCALYFTVLALVLGLVFNADKLDRWTAPSRLVRNVDVLSVTLIVGAVTLGVVRAARYHSVMDALTALVIAIWACFMPGSANYTTMSRSRRRVYRAAGYLLPAWFVMLALARLR
jgi:hypothetical protein